MQGSPTNRTATETAALAAGAVCGALVRFVTLTWWPAETAVVATTLILTSLGLLVWGLVSTVERLRPIRTAVSGFAGAAASVGILATIAISSTPLWCLAYIVAVPLCAVAGLAAGILLGTAAERRGDA
jgi:hypothetical protein